MKPLPLFVIAVLWGCSAKVSPAETDGAVASDASSSPEASIEATTGFDPVDPVCPKGRLPVDGTACDKARMGDDFCRLGSCGWGCEPECFCQPTGIWFCSPSCRDDYGCGTPPLCHPKTTPTCPGEDAGPIEPADAGCGGKVALTGSGPWDPAAGCWKSETHTFECVDGIDGGARITCFFQISTGQYWLADSTHIPSGPDFRYCSEAEDAAHTLMSRCK